MPRPYVANGNILPAHFVAGDPSVTLPTGMRSAIQADNTSKLLLGVSQQSTYDPPGVTGSTAYAAAAGQQIMVYSLDEECSLLVGTGGCTQGSYLVPDANGAGVLWDPTYAATNIVGFQAESSAAAGEYVTGRIVQFVAPLA